MNGLDLYRLAERVRRRLFVELIRRDFAAFGRGSTIELPVQIWGEERIRIGAAVKIGASSWLHALGPNGHITLGHGTRMSGHTIISAVESVTLGDDVLIARGVYIADHSHARADPTLPIREQGVVEISPVAIEDGAWLGHNVVVLPGSSIGRGAVVAANSVVRGDVPARTIAAGAPARIVKAVE
jgi:acetyltransferase-like isoleucine patch superfamily enzyme